ncbi:uncharacterized protein DUF4377 [Algoriphagus boseongensis]|uniref:Uncharacterized protein DUF4377 n=1 Tax=Algoriphagus boseongensis TaxID=1442587 RepID=A0A4R6T9J2_9BACT|nr:DUF4377 domain-containing protein [Algoriphagus boseongensis]TDQ18853.1 uncharacterized protein DUF4377 [Algoriphagus boseongensis]
MRRNAYLLFLCLLFSCTEKETKIIWVYPYRLGTEFYPNAEAGIFFLTQDKEELDYSSWKRRTESFEIKGFEYEEGYFYKLKVEYEADQPPQKLKLKSVLEKRKDYIGNIEGAWKNIPLPDQPYFPIFIRIQKLSRTLETYGGCFRGITGMGEVGERKIQLVDTYYRLEADKICLAQSPIQEGGFSFVQSTTHYQLTPDGFLEFFDEKGNLLIRFQPSE